MQQSKAAQEYQIKMQDIQSKNNQAMQKMQLEKEKLNVARENMKNDVEVAKINASNRASKNNKK
jgi:stress response protein YsnF